MSIMEEMDPIDILEDGPLEPMDPEYVTNEDDDVAAEINNDDSEVQDSKDGEADEQDDQANKGKRCFNCNLVGHVRANCKEANPDGIRQPRNKRDRRDRRRREPSRGTLGNKCYVCKEEGHVVKNCPNIDQEEKDELKDKCFKCKQSGHSFRTCPNVDDQDDDGDEGNRDSVKRCFRCHQEGHLRADCSLAIADSPRVDGRIRGGKGRLRVRESQEERARRKKNIKRIIKRETLRTVTRMCYICLEEGHRHYDCPNVEDADLKNSCFKCKESGHAFKDCPSETFVIEEDIEEPDEVDFEEFSDLPMWHALKIIIAGHFYESELTDAEKAGLPEITYVKSEHNKFDLTKLFESIEELPVEHLEICDLLIVPAFDWVMDCYFFDNFGLILARDERGQYEIATNAREDSLFQKKKTECVKKTFELVEKYTKEWALRYPNLKIIWTIPYPGNYNNLVKEFPREIFNPREPPSPEICHPKYLQLVHEPKLKKTYMSIIQYSFVHNLYKKWCQNIPHIPLISLTDMMFDEEKKKAFVDGEIEPIWDGYNAKISKGFALTKVFLFRLLKELRNKWLVVGDISVNFASAEEIMARNNKTQMELCKGDIPAESQKQKDYKTKYTKFRNAKAREVEAAGFNSDLYDYSLEWAYHWINKSKDDEMLYLNRLYECVQLGIMPLESPEDESKQFEIIAPKIDSLFLDRSEVPETIVLPEYKPLCMEVVEEPVPLKAEDNNKSNEAKVKGENSIENGEVEVTAEVNGENKVNKSSKRKLSENARPKVHKKLRLDIQFDKNDSGIMREEDIYPGAIESLDQLLDENMRPKPNFNWGAENALVVLTASGDTRIFDGVATPTLTYAHIEAGKSPDIHSIIKVLKFIDLSKYEILVLSPFDWIDRNENFEMMGMEAKWTKALDPNDPPSDKLIQHISKICAHKTFKKIGDSLKMMKILEKKWNQEFPQLTVFWVLPHPLAYGASDKPPPDPVSQVAVDDVDVLVQKYFELQRVENKKPKNITKLETYRSIVQFNLVIQITRRFFETMPGSRAISTMDIFLRKLQREEDFLNGELKLNWLPFQIMPKQLGSGHNITFYKDFWEIIRLMWTYEDWVIKNDNARRYNKLCEYVVPMEDSQLPIYKEMLDRFVIRKFKELKEAEVNPLFYNYMEEFGYMWHSKRRISA